MCKLRSRSLTGCCSGRSVMMWRADWAGILLVLLAIDLALGQNAAPPTMSADVARTILDDPTWVERDPEVERLRKMTGVSDDRRAAEVEAYIQQHEVEAARALYRIIASEGDDLGALVPYLKHPSTAVSRVIAGAALNDGHWELSGTIAERLPSLPPAAQASILGSVLRCQNKNEAASLGRVVLKSRLGTVESEDRGYDRHAVIVAVRLVARSIEADDAQLLSAVVAKFPEEPLLWAALSRTSAPKEIKTWARRAFQDVSKPLELRAAAALVFGKDNSDVMETVIGWIKDYIREFGGEEFVEWMRQHHAGPHDAVYKAKMDRALLADRYLIVLRELPADVLRRSARELLELGPRVTNNIGPVLAREVPDKLVGVVEDWSEVPPKLYPALYLAMDFDPTLSDRVKALIPSAEFARLKNVASTQGVDFFASTAATATLWD